MYLIDGNNLAGRATREFTDAERRGLLEMLARFAKLKQSDVWVVFDGIPDLAFPEGSTFEGVRVFYARPGTTADARIRTIVEQSRAPRDCMVVTADRELRNSVRARRGQVLSLEEFRTKIQEAFNRARPVRGEIKPSPSVNNLGEWLAFFGVNPQDAARDPDPVRVDPAQIKRPDPPGAKPDAPTESDLDGWLRFFGVDPKDAEIDPDPVTVERPLPPAPTVKPVAAPFVSTDPKKRRRVPLHWQTTDEWFRYFGVSPEQAKDDEAAFQAAAEAAARRAANPEDREAALFRTAMENVRQTNRLRRPDEDEPVAKKKKR